MTQQIKDRTLTPGTKLTDKEFAEEQELSEPQARDVLDRLRDDGYLTRRQKSGSHVRQYPHVMLDDHSPEAATAGDTDSDRRWSTDPVEVTDDETPGHVRTALGLLEGTAATKQIIVDLADKQPYRLTTAWVPTDILTNVRTPRDDEERCQQGPDEILDQLKSAGVPGTRSVEQKRTRLAQRADKKHLKVTLQASVLELTQIVYHHDRPVAYLDIVTPADVVYKRTVDLTKHPINADPTDDDAS